MAENVQMTSFLNMTGIDSIATDEYFECIRDGFYFFNDQINAFYVNS